MCVFNYSSRSGKFASLELHRYSPLLSLQILYMMMHRDLAEQLELAIRAVDNVTRVHYAFKDGRSFHWAKVTPFGAYDEFITPTAILNHNSEKQKEYYNVLSDHLTGYMEEVIALETILKDVYQTSYLNNTAYIKSRDSFSEHAQQINSYKMLFQEEIVQKAAKLWDEEVKTFTSLNMSFNLQKYNLLKSIRQLNRTANSAVERINNQILPVVAKALIYVSDTSISKHELANDILSPYFQHVFAESITDVIQTLKTHGQDMLTLWQTMKVTVLRIWTALLSDETTKEFYTAVMKDLQTASKDMNFSQPILAMTGIPNASNFAEKDMFEEFVHSLNADISVIQLTNKTTETEKLFASYVENTNVARVLQDQDTRVLHSYATLKDDMEHFVRSNEMSERFFRLGNQ